MAFPLGVLLTAAWQHRPKCYASSVPVIRVIVRTSGVGGWVHWAFIAVYVQEAVVPLGIHVNRQHDDVNRASEVHSLFRIEEH
jgi:hypothetical protein